MLSELSWLEASHPLARFPSFPVNYIGYFRSLVKGDVRGIMLSNLSPAQDIVSERVLQVTLFTHSMP